MHHRMSDGSFWGELQRRNVVRVVTLYAVGSFVVLQLADILFPALSLREEDIRWVLAALAGALPFVAVFSWFYEVTPEGLKPTRAVESDASIATDTGRRIDRIAIVLLSIAVVFLLVRSILLEPDAPQTVAEPADPASAEAAPETAEPGAPSVAVLPLVNMSSDAENEHFADGLTEELLNALAQNDNLRVAARTSSFFYKGKNVQLTEIGEALGVDHVLEGSVRKSGNQIRITVQLIKAIDGFHLWSKTYDRELLDVFAVQDEISQEVARAMEVTLVPEDPRIAQARSTDSAAAYELYLRANEALYTREEAQVRQALEWFREASALDPTYAPPLLGVAEAALVWQNNHNGLELLEADRIATDALNRAAALGFETARYWALRGLAASHLIVRDAGNYAIAVQAYERSLALNENLAIAYTWYATLMEEGPGALGAAEQHLALQRRTQLLEAALRLDPLNRVTRGNYLLNLWRDGERERFWEQARAEAARDPDYRTIREYMGWAHLGEGRFVEGLEAFIEAPGGGRSVAPMLRVLEALQEPELARQLMERVPENSNEYAWSRAWLRDRTDPLETVRARALAVMASPEPDPYGQTIGNRLLREGEFALARRFIEHAFPPLKAEIPETPRNTQLLAIYARVLHQTGDRDRARQMARLSLAQNRGKPLTGLAAKEAADVGSYLILDRTEDARQEFEALMAEGWRFHRTGFLDIDPLYASLLEEPEIAAIVEEADAELIAIRAECIALVREHGYLL